LLFHVDIEDDAIGRRARLRRDPHHLEIAQVLEPPLGAADERPVVGIAFREIELAPDDVVTRARISADIDELDVGALSLL
jgi:hypothetical protein